MDLVRRARNLGYNTLGLCDETTIAGYHDFDEACHAQGIRPVFGCRLFMTGLALSGETFPIDFLIETEQGYRNLVRLLTRYHARGEGEARALRLDDLRDRTHGLEAVLPADGEMPALIEARSRPKTELFLKTAVELFGGRVALAATCSTAEESAQARLIARLGRFANLKTLAGRHIYYPEPGDAAAAVFLQQAGGAPGRSYTPPEDVKSLPALWPEDEVLARWTGELEELPHEAGNFARRCTWRPARIRRAFPSMDLERGYDPNSYLFDLVIRGATQRYGEITDALKQRINREIEEIKAQNLAPYLLLCRQLAEALDERGVSRGVGRGRVVASVLAYCLGISRVDPLQYSLLPKNLIGEGEVFPAVMVEIPGSSAEGLVAWLLEVYGEEHVAEIGRIQDLRRDQMINELAAWAGMTEEERRLTHREKARLRSAGAAQRLDDMVAEGARARRWRDPALIGDLAARLAPRPRHWLGTGDRFVLSGEPLETMVPTIRSHQGKPVTGIEEAAIDRLGLARIVFVPHQLLDILDQAMRAARAQNSVLDFRNIPLDNRATFELLGRGDTIGIPPLEGVTLRCLLRKSQPTNILQLWRIKTEAIAHEADERPRDISEELPDVLLSYQCAYLKANYPLAFYSAAIGSVIEQGGNPSALLRAARRAGTEVHPPDINLSDWGPTVYAGHIRLGLASVRAFGRRAWDNVQAVRSGGHFTSLENFCERVDTRILNVRLLRNLIASGAMDSFEQNRAAMDAMVSLLQRRAREQAGGTERGEAQASLFDLEDWAAEERLEPAEHPAPAVAEWNPWEKQQHEFDALGFSSRSTRCAASRASWSTSGRSTSRSFRPATSAGRCARWGWSARSKPRGR
jgi:DNA polymerase III alpha subunit